jgi:hypothetical protein
MNRWKPILLIIAITIIFCSGFLFAQPQQPPPQQGRPPAGGDPRMEQMIDMMFRDIDADHNGTISKAEWMSFYEKQFKRMDKGGKGYLTRDDVKADMVARMRPPQQPQPPPQDRPRPAE